MNISKVTVDLLKNTTLFDSWGKPGHYSNKYLKAKSRDTQWIWGLHADAHDFDIHRINTTSKSSMEDVSRKVFSAHFGQLAIIFFWFGGMCYHGARFSNYEAWLTDPTSISPSAQIVWSIVGQDILNADVGGGLLGIQITSGLFHVWRSAGVITELQLYSMAIGSLVMTSLMMFGGWFHMHIAAPRLLWFQQVESMLNHHLILLGLGCLSWSGHQIHIALPINTLLDAQVDPKEIPLPHEFLLDKSLMG